MLRNRIAWGSVALTGLLALMTFSAAGANRPDVWKQDYAKAAADAKQSGQPLLVHFFMSSCPPCRQMERDVLHSSDVRDLLSKHFVAVLINSDAHSELQMQFNIQLLPTDIVIGPDGVELLRSEGSRDKKSYLAQLRRVVEQLETKPDAPQDRSLDERLVEKSTPGMARVGDSVPDKSVMTKKKPVAEQKLLVGLDRYSPVSLAKSRLWRKGKSEFALVYQGVVYLLYDSEEYREFQSDPAKYAPRLLGCDPVVLWNSDRAVPGSTQYGAYFDSELFLFSNVENRDRFKASPNLYSRPQHVLKVDQIDGPRWR